jgi:hypothetical protein
MQLFAQLIQALAGVFAHNTQRGGRLITLCEVAAAPLREYARGYPFVSRESPDVRCALIARAVVEAAGEMAIRRERLDCLGFLIIRRILGRNPQ